MVNLTREEREFIERVKPLLEKFLELCEREGIEPGAGSFVLSERAHIYHGVPFCAARWIHGEENAIGNMVTNEGENSRFKIILIVGSSQDIIMPCGICREAIKRYGVPDVVVLCANLSLTKIEKFRISDLYPYPYEGELCQ